MIQGKRIRTKICGITRVEDALAAAHAGADAIGLVFYAPSPRYVDIATAQTIVAELPAFVSTVGLFVNASLADVEQTLAAVSLDVLQFHGDETPAFCQQFQRRYIKAVRMQANVNLHHIGEQFATASALLVDAYDPQQFGGTGKTFDWQQLPTTFDMPLILAGGLNVDNIRHAIEAVQPWGVDVSGGVEQVNEQGKKLPGIKSRYAIEAFIKGVNGELTD